MDKIKIGLLPLYIEMYDRDMPQIRPRINEFREIIIKQFEDMGLKVSAAPVCRVKQEFSEAIAAFENEEVDAVVTLHLAYSPSLEASEILAGTRLPLVVLDTTPAYGFGPSQEVDEINFNHGIHGVQDMCCMLKRNKKDFFLEAGHWEKSDVLKRVAGCVRAVKVAAEIKKARVGRVGQPFDGMGDFAVPVDTMRSTIGIETVLYDIGKSKELIASISEEEIKNEMRQDGMDYNISGLNTVTHRRASAAGLLIRKWLEKEKLTAFTVNFTAIDKNSGIPCMPFLEAGKAMGRGIGYAGEGDVLTAALVGALASVYEETSFTEMFCPDWENDTIFLSHMGEINVKLADEKPILAEEDFPYTDAENPVLPYCRFKEGNAVLVNLAPGADDTYSLIVSSVKMLGVSQEDRLKNCVHGWFKSGIPVHEFLKAYSEAGGTHHIAVVYGKVAGEIEKFGRIMGWNVIKI
jgi:L-arabinose isomerase